MIIVKTPLRLSLGGGGSDLPSYYQRFGGFFVAGAIDLHISVQVSNRFNKTWIIRAPELQSAATIQQISHPLIRETLSYLDVVEPLHICTHGDVPVGSGLGGSGALTVGLIQAVMTHLNKPYSAKLLAHHAFSVEAHHLQQPIGLHDHLSAAHGGINGYTIATNGTVTFTPVFKQAKQREAFAQHLLLCFTGKRRHSPSSLQAQKQLAPENDSQLINNLHTVKQLGVESFNCLKSSRFDDFALLLKEHWQLKQQRLKANCDDSIENIYRYALNNGALAGKLVGSGGGGFFLFYSHDVLTLKRALQSQGLQAFEVSFSAQGSRVVAK